MQFNARKTLLALAAFLTGLALAVAPTLGANMSVTSGPNGSDTFSPKTVTVNQGESVTWTNASGSHNVKFDDGSFEQPASASSSNWTRVEDLQRRRVLPLLLRAHGGSGGSGMSGTVVVNAASGTTPPPGGGGGGGSGGGSGGGATPGSPTQPGGRRHGRPEAHTVREGRAANSQGPGTGGRSHRRRKVDRHREREDHPPRREQGPQLQKVTRVLQAGERSKLKLRLSRKTRASVASALRHRSRLKAKVTVSVRDGNGNSRSSSRSVKVKR